MDQTRSIRHFHNQQKNTSPDSARGGCVPFSARPRGLTQNLSSEKRNFVSSTYASSLNFSYTPIDAHRHLPVLYFVNSTNLDHSNSTHSTTRSQLTLSLCIPSAARRPGTISPLFTSTLLWNSLPSPIRSASSLHTFRKELQKYLGIPVIRPR